MEARLVEFVEVLRQNGLRIGVSESQDAVQATTLIDLSNRDQFRGVLRATLCKRASDREAFDRAFDFYFTGAAHAFEAIDRSLAQRIEEEGLLEGDELKMVLHQLASLAGGLSPLAQAALGADRSELARLFRKATLQLDFSRLQSPLQTGFFTRRMLSAAGGEHARADLRALEQELKARGLSGRGIEVVSRHVAEALRRVEQAARQEVDRQVRARAKKLSSGLNERAFHTLSRSEIDKTQRAVKALAQKLKTRLVRKQRSRRKGSLNPKTTLRKNLTTGGVPMVPQFRTRRPQRPDVVVLCDISDSVRNASRMMLLFVHTLQSLFSRVRSFVFVSQMGEVTEVFKAAKAEEAIELATTGRAVSMAGNSNYGHALTQFARAHLGSVTRRTTVLVIGDGRNNYNAPGLDALSDLKRRARRLVWICTEPRQNWGFGDSEMLRYEKACHQVVTVQSLADLESVAHELVPSR